MKKLFWLLFTVCISGCYLNDDSTNAVVTEDLIYVSSETARFSGRIVGSDGSISNHGFEVARNETFNDAIIVDNGAPQELGLFIGVVEGLESDQTYFFRAFVSGDNGTIYGTISEFKTFLPQASSISPAIADSGDEITIFAQNVTSDVEIFFGDAPAVINDVKFESIITVRVPTIESEAIVPVTVRMQDTTFSLGSFEYVVGRWRRESLEFPDETTNIFEPAYAQTEDAFVLGLGYTISQWNYDRMWQLDFETFSWTEIPYAGFQMRDPFRAGNCFGTGKISTAFGVTAIGNHFYCLDGSDFTFVGSTPFFLYKSIGAKINDDIYVFGGLTSDQRKNNLAFRYSEGEWSELGTHPVVPSTSEEDIQLDTVLVPISSELPNFVVDNRAFIIQRGIVWEFDTETLNFVKHDEVPLGNCLRGITEVLNGKVYLGLCGGSSQGFHEYDPINKVWKDKNRIPTNNNKYNVASFHHDGLIYVILNQTNGFRREAPKPTLVYSLSPDDF